MQPRIETVGEKKLVGKRMRMSLAEDKTPHLWRSFMPERKEIGNALNNDLISMQIFDSSFSFTAFDPHATFEKWAAVEVADFDAVPADMKSFTFKGGLYAVFLHKGPASTGPETFRYIFETWLPSSAYILDDRPHVAWMGANYKNEDPASEEDIWIPIKPKA